MIDDLYQQYAPVSISSRRQVKDAKISNSEIITISSYTFAYIEMFFQPPESRYSGISLWAVGQICLYVL